MQGSFLGTIHDPIRWHMIVSIQQDELIEGFFEGEMHIMTVLLILKTRFCNSINGFVI